MKLFVTMGLVLFLVIPVLAKDTKLIIDKLSPVNIQILLDRAGFSVGQIDGGWGSNSTTTMKTYQLAHGLPTTGEPDQMVWDKLTSNDTTVLYTLYSLTSTDVNGPFLEVLPEEMEEKAVLEGLYYTSSWDALGEKFHSSPLFLRKLNPNINLVEGQKIKVPNINQRPWRISNALDTTSTNHEIKIMVYTKLCSLEVIDSTKTILFHAPITPGGRKNPPPYGEWTVNKIAWNPTYYYNPKLFWDANPEDAKQTIAPGPRNPVGVVWINLTAKNYGIHGTPSPGRIGHSVSHGCVRMTNWDARQLAHLIKPGVAVIIKEFPDP